MNHLFNLVNWGKYFRTGMRFYTNHHYTDAREKDARENTKEPSRTAVLNFLLASFDRTTDYLEIGVRNPDSNFNHIIAGTKHSVDPGVEFEENPVDFKLTSDVFFEAVRSGKILSKDVKFDVIFVDGLHLAEQVDRDIQNALDFIANDGFVVLHDCNPPTEWHARTTYEYHLTPARRSWNGTTWKAFQKWRYNPDVYSCCIDTDFGVGVLAKTRKIGISIQKTNDFYEYSRLEKTRVESLNLTSFEDFKRRLV